MSDIFVKEIEVRNDIHYLCLYIKEMVKYLDKEGMIKKDDKYITARVVKDFLNSFNEVEREILRLHTTKHITDFLKDTKIT